MDQRTDTLCPGCFSEKGRASSCPHCGYDEGIERSPLVLPHRTLLHGQFVVGRVLGKPGGFGITYLGWDLNLQTRVAIKEFLPRDLAGRATDRATVAAHSGDDSAQFRFGLEQFLREARTLAQLDHPNIVRVRQFFEANGTAYLVMDYYQGFSLAEYLDQQGGRIPEEQAKQLMLPILDGLRAVHAKGFLHRDIKPQNIYLARLDSGGVRPILLDFGAARQAMGERSRSLSVVVSPGYAPFEQYHRKGHQGPWTDIYSAAAVLYRMVTGEAPPEANERMVGDDLKPAVAFDVSKRLSDALGEALAITAESRPQTVQTFQSLLWAEPSRTTPTPAAIPTPDPVAPPPPTTRWWPIALALGLPALALGGWSLYRTHPPAETPHPEVAALHRDADDRVYGIARKADTPEAYESYLDTCAADACGHRAEAEGRLAAARQRHEREAEQARAAESARQAEATRQADLADYAAAERAGTTAAYRRYLADCAPKGCARRAEAQANLDRLAQQDIKLPEMVHIPAGSFSMGCQLREQECFGDEKPAHRVQVAAFELGKYEVTFAEWYVCVSDGGCEQRPTNRYGDGWEQRPITDVSWDDAQQYLGWLSRKTGKAYRLPTEAEWEYAARAGTTTAFNTGNCITTSQANYDDNFDYNNCGAKTGVFIDKPQPDGHYPANPWGLYEMHGNVKEWVEDCWHDNYTGAPTDGSAWTQGSCPARVLRGGSWFDIPRDLRSASRSRNVPGYRGFYNGFRIARTLTP